MARGASLPVDLLLREELVALLNKHSAEKKSGTPDFLLADYLLGCLEVFERTVEGRDGWHGHFFGKTA